MNATMNRDDLAKLAATRGYTLHDSVTDERLARIHPRMLNGKPERLDKRAGSYLDAAPARVKQWIAEGCLIASYALGAPGDEVVAPPTTDNSLMLVVLPSFRVVAVVTGQGESHDGDHTAAVEMAFTILARPGG